jgi:membrane peptidoglycan carboxypeptidase
MVRAAARLGVASPLRAVPSAVLGTNEVTPLGMAGAYATLAAGGRRAAPFGVRRITGPDGRVLYQARPETDQVLAPGVAAIATDVLREVVDHGTGVRGRIGRPAAGKTGTTQDHADAWFVGFTPSLATAVWVGYPQGQVPMVPPRTAGRVSGGTWPSGPGSCGPRWPAGRPLLPARHPAGPGGPGRGAGLPAQPVHPGGRGGLAGLPQGGGPDPDLPGAGGAAGRGGPGGGRGAVARAAGWLEAAGLSLAQRLAVDGEVAPGTVLAQSPAGGTARPRGRRSP